MSHRTTNTCLYSLHPSSLNHSPQYFKTCPLNEGPCSSNSAPFPGDHWLIEISGPFTFPALCDHRAEFGEQKKKVMKFWWTFRRRLCASVGRVLLSKFVWHKVCSEPERPGRQTKWQREIVKRKEETAQLAACGCVDVNFSVTPHPSSPFSAFGPTLLCYPMGHFYNHSGVAGDGWLAITPSQPAIERNASENNWRGRWHNFFPS